MNKKGISPLIATVLLVSFVVILSGVVMFWGRQYVTELMEKRGEVSVAKLECESVDIEIISAGSGSITIRNAGPVKLAGFMLRWSGGKACEVNEIVNSYEDETIDLDMKCPGSGDQLNVVPMLKPQGIGAPPIPCSTKNKLVKIGG